MWTWALIFAVLSAVLFSIFSNGVDWTESGMSADAASENHPAPIGQPGDQPSKVFQQGDYGWGPVRLTDW
jgi:hypothetical protein